MTADDVVAAAFAEERRDGGDPGLPVREAELHELVELHQYLETLVENVEGELEFRYQHGQKLSGSTGERYYAGKVASGRYRIVG